MREMLLGAAKSYYVGLMNRHISNVEILLSKAVGIGEHHDIQASIDSELDKIAMADDKLNVIVKYFERRQENVQAEEKKESKSK
jgi:hypothetical protein|tara:strand:+ start:379 stop:630 length:252 start_codon:yes stop_codon:yes gene_type:complete